MSRKRATDPTEQDEPACDPPRPAPYPLDAAMEEAFAAPPVEAGEPRDRTNPGDSWLDEPTATAATAATSAERPRVGNGAEGTGDGNHGNRGDGGTETEPASVQAGPSGASGDPSRDPAPAPAPVPVAVPEPCEPPETVADRIAALPAPWMRRLVAALFRCGGIMALARRAVAAEGGGVSLTSIDRYRAKVPLFDALCREAAQEGDGMVEAAVLRGATIGDVQPVFQGGLKVGYKRVRNTKDAELWMKRRGLIGDGEPRAGQPAPVPVDRAALPGIVRAVTARLFAIRSAQRAPVLDAATGRPTE